MANNYGQTVQALGLGSGTGGQSSSVISINHERGPWLVTLLPPTGVNGAALPGVAGDYFARVSWGGGGVRATTEIDWPLNGGTFVVSSDSLDVVGVASLAGLGGAGTPPQSQTIQWSAFASRCDGPRAGNASRPPRRTRQVALGIPSDIPNYATLARLSFDGADLVTDLLGGNVLNLLVDWVDRAGASVARYPVFADWNAFVREYAIEFFSLSQVCPVPSGAVTLLVQDNGSTAAVGGIRAAYDLDMG